MAYREAVVTLRLQPPSEAGPLRVPKAPYARDDAGAVQLDGLSVACSQLLTPPEEPPYVAAPRETFATAVEPLIGPFLRGRSSTVLVMGEAKPPAPPTAELLGSIPLSDVREAASDGLAVRSLRAVLHSLNSLTSTGAVAGLWSDHYALKIAFSGLYSGTDGSQTLKTVDVLERVRGPDAGAWGAEKVLGGRYVGIRQMDGFTYPVNKLLGSESNAKRLAEKQNTLCVTISVLDKAANVASHLVVADVLPQHNHYFDALVKSWLAGGSTGGLSDVFHPGSTLSLIVPMGTSPSKTGRALTDVIDRVFKSRAPPEFNVSAGRRGSVTESVASSSPGLSVRAKLQRAVAGTRAPKGKDQSAGLAVAAFGSLLEKADGEQEVTRAESITIQDNVKRLQNQLMRRDGELLRVQHEKEEAQKDMGALKRAVQTAHMDINAQQSKIDSLNDIIGKLNEELDTYRLYEERLVEAEHMLQAKTQQNASLTDDNAQQQRELEGLNERLRSLLAEREGDVHGLQKAAAGREEEIDELRRALQKMQRELEESLDAQMDAENELADRQRAIDDLAAELAAARESIQDSEALSSDLKAMNEALQANQNLASRLETAQAGLREAESQLATRTPGIPDDEVRVLVSRWEQKCGDLEEDVEAAKQELSRLQLENERLLREHADMQDALDREQALAAKVAGMHNTLQDQHRGLRESWEKATNELTVVKVKLEESAAEANRLRFENVDLTKRIGELEKELAEDTEKSKQRRIEDAKQIADLEAKLRMTDDDLKEKLRAVQRDLHDAELSIEHLTKENDRARDAAKKLEDALSAARRHAEEKETQLLARLREAEAQLAASRKDLSKEAAELQRALEDAKAALAGEVRARKADSDEGTRALKHEQDAHRRGVKASQDAIERLKEDHAAEIDRLRQDHERAAKASEHQWERLRQADKDEAARTLKEELQQLSAGLQHDLRDAEKRVEAAAKESEAAARSLEDERRAAAAEKAKGDQLHEELGMLRKKLDGEARAREDAGRAASAAGQEAERRARKLAEDNEQLTRQLADEQGILARALEELADAKRLSDDSRKAAGDRERAALEEVAAAREKLRLASDELNAARKVTRHAENLLEAEAAKLAEARAQAGAGAAELSGARRALADAQEHAAALQAALDASHADGGAARQQTEDLRAELLRKDKAVLDAERRAGDLEKELAQIQADIEKLEEDQAAQVEGHFRVENTLRSEAALLEDDLRRAEQRIGEEKAARQQAADHASNLQKKLAAAEASAQEASLRLQAALADAGSCKKIEADAASRASELAERVHALELEMRRADARLHSERDAARSDLAAAKSEQAELEGAVERHRREIQTLQDTLKAREVGLDKLKRGEEQRVQALHAALQQAESLKAELADEAAEHRATKERLLAEQSKLQDAADELHRRGNAAAVGQRALARAEHQLEAANAEIDSLKADSESARQEAKTALDAADERIKQKLSTADEVAKALEARHRDLEAELAKAHAATSKVRKDMQKLQADCDERAGISQAELHEANRTVQQLGDKLLKAKAESEEWRVRVGDETGAKEAAAEAQRLAELEVASAHAAADRALERVRLADARAAAAEERASRAAQEVDAARHDVDDARLLAQNEIDLTHQRELDAVELQQKERRARLAAEAKLQAAEEEAKKSHEAAKLLTDDLAAAQQASRDTAGRERELERKAAAAAAELEEAKAALQRQTTLAKDETERQSNRLTTTAAAKQQLEESLVHEQAEAARLRHKLEIVEANALQVQQELHREKAAHADTQKKVFDLRDDHDVLSAAQRKALADKEHELTSAAEELRNERAQRRSADDRIKTLAQDLHRAQADKDEAHLVATSLQEVVRRGEAVLREKEREFDRGRLSQEAALKDAEEEIAGVRGHLREANRRAERVAAEAEHLKAGADRLMEARVLDQRLQEAEEQAKLAREATRAANRQLEEVTRRADSASDSLARATREHETAQEQLDAAGDLAELVLASPGGSADAVKAQLGSRSDLGRVHHALGHIARKISTLRGDCASLRGELGAADQTAAGLRAREDEMAGETARYKAEARDLEQRLADEKRKHGETKVAGNEQARSAEARLEAERLAAEQAAEAHLKHAAQIEASAREIDRTLRNELQDALDHASQLEAKLRMLHADSTAAQVAWQKEKAQLESDVAALADKLAFHEREVAAEQERCGRRVDAAEARARAAAAALVEFDGRAAGQQAEADAAFAELERLRHRAERATAGEAAARAELAKAKAQAAAGLSDSDAAARREADAAEKLADSELRLASCMMKLHASEVAVESQRRAVQKLEDLLEYADAEVESLYSKGRLSGVAFNPSSMVRRPDRDQALAAISRRVRKIVAGLMDTQSPALLARALHTAAHGETGVEMLKLAGDWCQAADATAENTGGEIGPLLRRAARAAEAAVRDGATDDAISQGLLGVAAGLADELEALGGVAGTGGAAVGPGAERQALRAFEDEVALLAARPSFADGDFDAAVAACEGLPDRFRLNAGLRDLMRALQAAAASDLLPFTHAEGALSTLPAELLTSLALSPLFSDVEAAVELCDALSAAHPAAAADLARLRSHVVPLGDALLHQRPAAALSDACAADAAQFLQKIVAGVYSSSGGGRAAPVYKWSKDGKRRMQAGLDALEGRLSDGEREVCRVKDEAKSLKTDLERCRAVLKGLEREADLGEKEAVGRLIVHQSTAEEMKAELTKLTGRLATAGDELHDAFACQRAAEEAKWAAEARLKGSESELRRLTTTADRLQAEAEALRARLRESDDAAELHERRLNERDAAHQRRADALQRDLQLTRGKARSLEDAGAAALAEKKKVEIELSDALRRSEAVENRLRKVESSALDSQRRAEEAERALDIALTDAQRAAADAAEAAARQKLAEAEAGEARARAEAAEADLWAAENARDDARRHAEALDRECRQVDLDREQLGAALAAAEDRAAEAERLASERLLKQHTADELSAQVSRLSDRLLAAQRETQDLRDAARKVEKERWDIEGRLRTAEGDRQTLLKQADKTQQDLDALTAKARWGQDQADRAKRLDTEKSDALRRADGLARDVQEARSRQKLADVERAEIAEKLLSAEVDISELRRKGDMARHKVKTLEQEINDAHRRAHDADVRADACEQRLLEEETTALARYQRAEAELDELRAHVADGGGAREQLAASLQRVSQLQDGEAELLLRIQHLETDLSAAHRAAAGAEEIRARLLEVNRRIEESEESLQAAEEARRAMDAEMHDARDQCHAAEHKARDAKRRADLLERELDDARTRLRQAEADKGEMHERMLSAENTREDWRRKLNLSQHEARSLQTEVEDLQRQVKLTEKQADEAQSDAARFRAELLHLEAGADELRRSVAESATTRQQLAEANRRLERLADAEAGLGAARQKAEVDQSEIKRLLSAVDDLLSKQNETILRAERAEEKLAAQEDSRRRLETEAAASKEHSRDTDAKMRKAAHLAEAAQRDLNEARDRVKALDSEVQALDHRLLSAERAKEEAKRRAETAEKRGLSLEQALEDGQRERRATEQRADEAQAQADQLQVALHALEAEVAESRKVVLEAAGLRQEVADLSKRLANSESLSEEHRASAARLDAQLRQAEGDLADMQRHVAASNELRIKLGESRRKNDIAEGQLHGLEKARATAEHHLSSTHDAVAALEQQLADTNRRVAGLESELFAANDRCARAEGECAALQEALVGNETAREDLRSRGELSEAAAAQLSSVAAADAARAGAAERRAAAAEERLALAVEQLLGCNAKAEAAEARLLGVQAEGHDARAALAKVAETRQKLAGGEEREAALRREVARLHADLDGAVRAATAAQALEDELVGTTKRLAEFEARAALDEEARKKMALDSSFLKEDTLHADLRARTAEERIADLELLVDTLKADHAVTVHGLQFEVEGLADKLKAQSIETELASVLAAKHEANCAELASGVQLLQAELEQRPTDDRLISLAEQLKYVSEELSRVNEQRTLWEAEARSMQDELQQTDRAVATLVATAPQTALSTHLPGLSSYHTRDSSSPLALPSRPLAHWARAIAALDPLHAKELNTLKNEVRAAADLSTSESEKQALETCHERLGHVQRRMNRGDMPSTTMLETIGDALLSGPIVSGTESTRERELVEALDGAAVSLSRGTRAAGIPHWSQWEAEMASLGLAQGAHTLQAASRSQKLDAGLLQALAAGVRDGGWELLEAVDHLAHGRPMPRAPPYCREDPILASVHTKPEAASLAAEYAECTLALDPASAAAMAVLAGAKRVECGWGSPQALQAFFEKSASAANDVSVRTSLRSAAQRIGRCSQIAPVLAVLNGGAGDPAWVDGLIHCRDDQVASGVVELANSVGERLQALQRGNGGRLGWEMLAARVVLETAVVTPPHAPHNIFRSLRMMSMAPPAGARGAAVLQQLRDDARAASAQLYDAAEVQLALRKTGERLASLQRQTAEPWQLAAIAAGLASGLSPAAAGRDKSRLPRLFRDAQRTRTVPRLSLSEICSAVAAGGDASIPHTTALTRLHALHRRSETGGIVESWEVAAIHEALHGTTQAAAPAASPTPTLPFLPDAPPAPPSGPMRAAAEQSELRAGLRKLDAFLKSVDLLSGEALSYKAQCVNLQARLADAVADTFAHNAAEKEEAAVLQSQVRDLERQLLLSRDETEALRLRELAATGRENALKLAVVHTEGELTHIRSHAEMHQHDAVSLNASIHTLWNILSPLAGLPSALTPTPDDLAQLAMAIKAKVLAAVETEAHLKALARRYAGVLSSVRLDPSVNDLEAIIAVLTSVLDKLMADVEEAQQVITRQNELLRLTSHTVTASAYELADLTQEVSPRKVHESAGDMLSAHRTSSTALHPPLHRRSSNASAYYSYRRDRTL